MVDRLAIENAVIDAMKLAKATAKGVRCVIKRSGMTGYGAHRASTYKKASAKMALTASRPSMSGCDHDSSSVVLILNADNMVATKTINVKEPRKSIRPSFEDVDSFATVSGSVMLTLRATSVKETRSKGACPMRVDERLLLGLEEGKTITCRRKAARLD